ncbi:MAG: 1-acyl-sn-glycerol-3-phosphate acyltransferase [Mycobacteriaceae bacterium]|nr:1-acyl-sn-glycerol-3-phosphate acyltransferase [Mycobacteriaceae bacterium]
MTAAHQWVPVSPCGTRCIDRTSTVTFVTAVWRVLSMFALLAAFPIVNVATPRSGRAGVQRGFARAAVRCCGVRLRVRDHRPGGGGRYAPPGVGVLVVAGHVSWLDVVVLAAVQPVGFVARADMTQWPVVGRLARRMRVIPIVRERLRELPAVVSEVGARLRAGERVAVFPEGTTWCGRSTGRMRPALFQSAVDTGTPVQPVRLRYLDAGVKLSTVPGFVGDDSLVASIGRILRTKGLVAEVILLPLQRPGTDRRDLAVRCERAIDSDREISIPVRLRPALAPS